RRFARRGPRGGRAPGARGPRSALGLPARRLLAVHGHVPRDARAQSHLGGGPGALARMSGAVPRAERWRGRRVLVTGHPGVVGGWLATWLTQLGARVHGYSLDPPSTPSFFEATHLASRLASSVRGDIRDRDALARAFGEAAPQDVIHLAAQPIVRAAYRDPVETISTNVMGTVQVLEACRAQAGIERIVAFTTDKVYRNDGSGRPFEEGDPLGGNEPYSASKAACDWAIAAYRESYFRASSRVAAVRAGNIVGG